MRLAMLATGLGLMLASPAAAAGGFRSPPTVEEMRLSGVVAAHAAKSRLGAAKKPANKAKRAIPRREPYLSCRGAVIVGADNMRVEGTLGAT